MKIKYLLILSLILSGCDSGSESKSTQQKIYEKDGIYLNEETNSLTIVDIESTGSAAVTIGYSGTAGVRSIENITIEGNVLKGKGVIVKPTIPGYGISEPDATSTITFSETTAAIKLGERLNVESDRLPSSASLKNLEGTYNTHNGSTWTIYEDGSFIANSSCTFSGQLTRKKDYFTISDVSATGCFDDYLEDSLHAGYLTSLQYGGSHYILVGLTGESISYVELSTK